MANSREGWAKPVFYVETWGNEVIAIHVNSISHPDSFSSIAEEAELNGRGKLQALVGVRNVRLPGLGNSRLKPRPPLC